MFAANCTPPPPPLSNQLPPVRGSRTESSRSLEAQRSSTTGRIRRERESEASVLGLSLVLFLLFVTPNVATPLASWTVLRLIFFLLRSSTDDIISAVPITAGFTSRLALRELDSDIARSEPFYMFVLGGLWRPCGLHRPLTGNSPLYQTIDRLAPLTHPVVKKNTALP